MRLSRLFLGVRLAGLGIRYAGSGVRQQVPTIVFAPMVDASTTDQKRGTGAFLLLPFAVALHVAEEWFFGFTDWARTSLGMSITPDRFVAINTIGLLLFALGAIFAYRERQAAWVGVALTALVGVNALIHITLSVAVGVYSPGAATGLLLYLPLSVVVFRWAFNELRPAVIVWAVAVGIALHAMATLSAATW